MKYAIIGTGAVGSYYGGKLAHAGCDVHFLLHSDYEYVNLHGMQIDSTDLFILIILKCIMIRQICPKRMWLSLH